jgi:hypothetical protein
MHGPRIQEMQDKGIPISSFERESLNLWRDAEKKKVQLERMIEEKRRIALHKRGRKVYEKYVGSLNREERDVLQELSARYPAEYFTIARMANLLSMELVDHWLLNAMPLGASRLEALFSIEAYLEKEHEKALSAHRSTEEAGKALNPVVVEDFQLEESPLGREDEEKGEEAIEAAAAKEGVQEVAVEVDEEGAEEIVGEAEGEGFGDTGNGCAGNGDGVCDVDDDVADAEASVI